MKGRNPIPLPIKLPSLVISIVLIQPQHIMQREV